MYITFLFRSPRHIYKQPTSLNHFVICHFSIPHISVAIVLLLCPALWILSQGGTHQPCLSMSLKQPHVRPGLHKRMYPTCFNLATP